MKKVEARLYGKDGYGGEQEISQGIEGKVSKKPRLRKRRVRFWMNIAATRVR